MNLTLHVNGADYSGVIEPRTLLVDFLREQAGLTGTHVGCSHGVCGACTVLVDGATMRGCLMLAVQAEGAAVRTVEGLAEAGGRCTRSSRHARVPRRAMRVLHAGHADDPDGVPGRDAEPDRNPGAGGADRQSLTLHRLPRHRGRRPARRQA